MNNFAKIFFVVALSIIADNSLNAQAVVWRQVLGGPYIDIAYNCIELKDSGYAATGLKQIPLPGSFQYINKAFIIKFDKLGNILWDKNMGDSLTPSESATIIQDSSGNIYLPYKSSSGVNLAKMDSDGNIIWIKNYSYNAIYFFYGVQFVDNFKNLVLLSLNTVLGIYPTSGITKIDSSGNLIWTKSFYDSIPTNSFYTSHYNSFLFTDKAYYICGAKGDNPFLIKTDTSGNVIWNKRYFNNLGIWSIAQNSENTFIAACYSLVCCYTSCMKFDSSGTVLWIRNYNNDSLARSIGPNGIIKNKFNNFVLGTTSTYNIGRLMTIDSLGNILSSNFYYYPPGFYIDQENANNTSDSGYIISGSLDSDNVVYQFPKSGGKQIDILVFKTDKTGNTVFISNNNKFITGQTNISIYPNPFNLSFNIKLNLILTSEVRILLYDLTGKLIKKITNKKLSEGEYKFYVDTPGLSSGVYFLKTIINNKSFSNRIMLIK